jgi:DNA modification methylase
MELDLFGNEIIKDVILKEEFLENPFSILDAKSGSWQNRKKNWISKGIKGEIGRDAKTFGMKDWAQEKQKNGLLKGNTLSTDTSVFDPALCELMYKWFAPENGKVLDPFAGGSVRGIVANYLGYKYTGIDIRQEQVDSNREQSIDILDINNQPQWYVGDSNIVLDELKQNNNEYDMILSCPPYGDLEVYSDLEGDISNMNYNDFMIAYRSIIKKSCSMLKDGGFAVFVVGEFRNKNGNYVGFVPDTIKAFMDCGMKYYNEAILSTSLAAAAIRAKGNMKSKKLVKVHQNILIFKK